MGQQLKDGLGQAWNMVATFVPKLVGFLIVLLIGWLIAKAVSKALGLVLGKAGFGKLVEKTGLLCKRNEPPRRDNAANRVLPSQ